VSEVKKDNIKKQNQVWFLGIFFKEAKDMCFVVVNGCK